MTSGSSSAWRVSASRPMAPTGVLSSWLMLATKSRAHGLEVAALGDVVDDGDRGAAAARLERSGGDDHDPAGWAEQVDRAAGRLTPQRGVDQLPHRRLDEGVGVTGGDEGLGGDVAVEDLARVVDDEHRLGQRVEGLLQPRPRLGRCHAIGLQLTGGALQHRHQRLGVGVAHRRTRPGRGRGGRVPPPAGPDDGDPPRPAPRCPSPRTRPRPPPRRPRGPAPWPRPAAGGGTWP